MRTLGNDLRELRMVLSMDLRQAARLCRISIVDYGSVERAETPLTVDDFAAYVRRMLAPRRYWRTQQVKKNRARLAAAFARVRYGVRFERPTTKARRLAREATT